MNTIIQLVLGFISFTVPLNVKYFINIHILRLIPRLETVFPFGYWSPIPGWCLIVLLANNFLYYFEYLLLVVIHFS